MENIKIALIDTGVNYQHEFLKDVIKKQFYINKKGERYKIIENENIGDFVGHGTGCASVIRKECKNIEIYSFCIVDKNGNSNIHILEIILEYIKNLEINLINLSLSIMQKTDLRTLKRIIKCLDRQGKILIVSVTNNKNLSFPASLKECIGVQGGILDEIDSIWFDSHKKIQAALDYTPYLHCNNRNTYSMFGKSNSYATAKLTGIIAQLMVSQKVHSKQQLFIILEKISRRKRWYGIELQKSRRKPQTNKYNNDIDLYLCREIAKLLEFHLKIDKNYSLSGKLLLSARVGIKYENCFEILKLLENKFCFDICDYTQISREDFYTIYHITHLVQKYL